MDPIEEDAEQLDFGFGAEGPGFDPDLNVLMTKEDEIGRSIDIVAAPRAESWSPRSVPADAAPTSIPSALLVPLPVGMRGSSGLAERVASLGSDVVCGVPAPPEGISLSKTLVTGATAGIGLETARGLAARGHEVWVHGRSGASAMRAVAALRAGDSQAALTPVVADLASLDEVRALAESLRGAGLDRIIHNAGVVMANATRTIDGFETTWAVNHLAPFLLTSLLIEEMLEQGEARVITVSSVGHRSGRIRFDDVNLDGGYDHITAYCQTKLANVLFTEELARRTAGTSVVAHSLDPGTVRTRLLDRTGFGNQPAKSPAEGARTSVLLATAPGVAAFSGGYFADEKHATAVRTDPAVARRLWELSERQTNTSFLDIPT